MREYFCSQNTALVTVELMQIFVFYLKSQNRSNIGQREGFSQKDVQKLNNMYQCKRKRNATATDMIMDVLGVGPN